MATNTRLKKGDRVIVLSGKHRGETGELTKLDREKNRGCVIGLNLIKKHLRPTKENPGKIENREAPIHLSNLAYVDTKDGKPTKLGYKRGEDGKKFRFEKRTGGKIDE